jgi:hypothetical protein
VPHYFDRVQETTTTTGTGTLTLAGAVSGFQTFAAVLAVGDTIDYCITDPVTGAWEVGEGTLLSSTTLSRTNVLSSSNAGALVSFAAGTKTIFNTQPASEVCDVSLSAAMWQRWITP